MSVLRFPPAADPLPVLATVKDAARRYAAGPTGPSWTAPALRQGWHLSEERSTLDTHVAESSRFSRKPSLYKTRGASHPKTGRNLTLRPARVPVDQHLRHIHHVETSPRHQGSRQLVWTGAAFDLRGPHQRRHARRPGAELRERALGNYVSGKRLNLGKYLSADTLSKDRPDRPS